jgi:hypothetical protein
VADYEGTCDIFAEITKLMKCGSIEVNKSNCSDLKFIFQRLDNPEVLNRIIGFEIGKEELSISNCIRILKVKSENNCDFEKELKFVASHFHEFDLSDFESIGKFRVEILEGILGHENLLLKNEDSLIEFIVSLGKEFSSLYKYVEFSYLTTRGIEWFLQFFSLEDIDAGSWASICRRLRRETPLRGQTFFVHPRYKSNDLDVFDRRFAKELVFRINKSENGILAYLSGSANAHLEGCVDVTNPSIEQQRRKRGRSDSMEWENPPDSWICFDFKQRLVSLQHYTLTIPDGWSGDCVRWEIEGSNDKKTWNNIDVEETEKLYGDSDVKTFECSEDCNEFFRLIRIKQIGNNSDNSEILRSNNIEFFGTLKRSG